MKDAGASLAFQKDLVLVGGGHAHALVLLQWAMQPLPQARLTLISEYGTSPYSGMLPGLIAGHYTFDDVHIDLRKLCRHAGVRFIQARVCGVDSQARRVHLFGRPSIEYDVLSINTGITPELSVTGAAQYAVPVKPIANFWQRWQGICERLQTSVIARKIAVVGGGAGGVELVLAMAERLRNASSRHTFLLVTRSASVLPDYPQRLQRRVHNRLNAYGITVHTAQEVITVDATGVSTTTGELIAADHVFWCTQARPPDWLANSGLTVTARGFLAVNACLQNPGNADVFAAGDCAWLTTEDLPRAGVYAVRQAPVLKENLCLHLQGLPLKPYKPQKRFLSLIACGQRDAVGARGRWNVAGHWVWYWKDHIDRRFMRMFHQLPLLPPLAPEQASEATAAERCGGCGGKVGADILQQALTSLRGHTSPASACDLSQPEDAAILAITTDEGADTSLADDLVLVQSVDALKPLFDDPWLFARVATLHALSDLFAMHAKPHSAQLMLQMPLLRPALQLRDLQQVLQGVTTALATHGAILVGGHTLEAEQLQIGLTVNAFSRRSSLLKKSGVKPGDLLILTKPLGIGAIFAAAMRGAAEAKWVEAAIACMLQSNAQAAEVFAAYGAHALTDITGFGLLGHLREMAGHAHGATLFLDRIPVVEGALACIARGYESTLASANRRLQPTLCLQSVDESDPRLALLYDPQTSGGLLAAIPASAADACLHELNTRGAEQSPPTLATIIGQYSADGWWVRP